MSYPILDTYSTNTICVLIDHASKDVSFFMLQYKLSNT